MSIIESLQAFISTCPALNAFADLHVDGLEPDAVNYSIDTLPGSRILSQDLAGTKTREFPFALTSREAAVDDLARIANTGFYEDFADWLEEQTDNDTLPVLGMNKAVESIEATSWGYLYQRDENDQTAIYQIICKMTYTDMKG
ncbi:MAG: chloramphenicol resistance protein [Clostridium sp.]|uniref:chloramphenicol resistance protein n=1 Tax=Clostridium sp. TaxID=1506 RepID=UPI00290FB082|nr:chloramphenicol resistance protein [Clostridium sp.]MDU7339022.1 chloramphenicol resistance protein [Clostridium sp.]